MEKEEVLFLTSNLVNMKNCSKTEYHRNISEIRVELLQNVIDFKIQTNECYFYNIH